MWVYITIFVYIDKRRNIGQLPLALTWINDGWSAAATSHLHNLCRTAQSYFSGKTEYVTWIFINLGGQWGMGGMKNYLQQKPNNIIHRMIQIHRYQEC